MVFGGRGAVDSMSYLTIGDEPDKTEQKGRKKGENTSDTLLLGTGDASSYFYKQKVQFAVVCLGGVVLMLVVLWLWLDGDRGSRSGQELFAARG